MSSLVALLIALPAAVAIGWFVWYIWNNNRVLDQKLAMGDMSLLTSSNYKITEIIQAPAGSRVDKVAIQQVPMNAQGYVREVLPDGRVALIPIAMNQQFTQVHSTTHTNQQPPIQ